MPLSAFDGIAYINLDRREKRKETLLKVLAHLNVDKKKIHRIAAYDDPFNGIRGCLQSHIKALEFVQKMGWKRGLILEDDCHFLEDSSSMKKETFNFFSLAQDEWDVYLLGSWYWRSHSTPWKNILQIKYSRRAHAYCVHPSYISTLRNCFQKGYEIVKPHPFYKQSRMYATDILWEELQFTDRWYGPKIPLAYQRESFSDIEHCTKQTR